MDREKTHKLTEKTEPPPTQTKTHSKQNENNHKKETTLEIQSIFYDTRIQEDKKLDAKPKIQ